MMVENCVLLLLLVPVTQSDLYTSSQPDNKNKPPNFNNCHTVLFDEVYGVIYSTEEDSDGWTTVRARNTLSQENSTTTPCMS